MLRNTDIAGLLTRYKNGLLKLPYDLNAFPYPPPVCNLIESVLSPMKFAMQKASTVLAGILLSSSLSVGVRSQCPDFTTYSASPQGNPSNGTLGLPFMRPAPACRTFNSTAVEQVIDDMKARLKVPRPDSIHTSFRHFRAPSSYPNDYPLPLWTLDAE
ncbi:hypothetical protein FB446DRAFT_714018 [Lentinula raphanica]|nr:hypothetical protein FB446DRAFT_714018 [Lentinula raphanica]